MPKWSSGCVVRAQKQAQFNQIFQNPFGTRGSAPDSAEELKKPRSLTANNVAPMAWVVFLIVAPNEKVSETEMTVLNEEM